MIVPQFTFDADVNGYLSESFEVPHRATARIELASLAPVVVQKMEEDGGFATYGQTPECSDNYELSLDVTSPAVLRLATPVDVRKCYILLDDETIPL